ncbi:MULTISPECIES: hypothetical protein [Nostocales]|uniref:Uncharacterized protein n=3 Tax=Nostocales TaxID=1161 RepID=A0A0C1MWL5_9CYAN|nr:hypothetical protein [Tolypothrix bouteillei]KAF3889963.1 hypothetical protein DA73_0400034235 [Tolypothrix bouteillei VB521301]
MSIWVLVALISYLLGALIQWTALKQQFQELDEYTNFPIVWIAKVVLTTGCFLEALAWPFELLDSATATE